jgi:penicillin-binding protein 2
VIVGIGQGYTLVTPMQLAQATATLANDGVTIRPHLVTGIQENSSGIVSPVPIVNRDKIPLKPSNIAIVRQGMMDVTRPGGTASSVGAGSPYLIAAKTGTAQVVGIKQNEKYNAGKLAERHLDHALFIAYAPAENPKIALAVIVENGGHGGSVAGPIARKVMDYYLLGKSPDPVTEKPKGGTAKPTPEEELLHD